MTAAGITCRVHEIHRVKGRPVLGDALGFSRTGGDLVSLIPFEPAH